MSSRKRKNCKDLKCVFFPDDVQNSFQKAKRETSGLSSASSAKSWEKCGDSFLDTSLVQNQSSSVKKLSAVRKLLQPPASGDGHGNEDSVQIVWSSSEQSDDESPEQRLSRAVVQRTRRPHRVRRRTAPSQSYTRALHRLSTDQDDHPDIDTESDLDESEEDAEKDSGQQISECESDDVEEDQDLSLKAKHMTELEISGYASDTEECGRAATSGRLDAPSFPPQTGEGSRRSVSDWVRSAQAMLHTPQKPAARQARTPEDSAKKKRKFQSGGLAERLRRLQARQRSAVSFWRHQTLSDTSATAERPGVLVLEVLEVRDECGLRLARCGHPPGPPPAAQPASPERSRRPRGPLALLARETAAQLLPGPGDIIHIHPPWQSLSMEGWGCDIILNTHFSQKASRAAGAASTPPGPLLPAGGARPYSLCETFGLLDECGAQEESSAQQAADRDGRRSAGASGPLTRHSFSLLETIEGLGRAGSVGQDVEVVVQRVYSVPVPDCSPASILKPRAPPRSSPAPPPLPPPPPAAERGKTRLCVLVQDAFGMFSVVQLHLLASRDHLRRHRHMWQGRTCVLRGIKVVQRVTRERCSRLFSLIDSLWPPVMSSPSPGLSNEGRPAGPAPSFCYLLSGQESSVRPTEDQATSPLYLPPSTQTLRDILQGETKTRRCSFVATVIYKRISQGGDEAWLTLTDPSLQEEGAPGPARRTAALCVSASCALASCVLAALHSPAACRLSITDAIKEHGVLLCVEQSVVELCSATEAPDNPRPPAGPRWPPHTPGPPVRLDGLSAEVTPNTLCSLQGVIVGVDESTAYSWPTCNRCGADNLEMLAERPETFHCVSCKSAVDKPDMKFQLEVFLTSSLSDCTVKVKLQQNTITSILDAAAAAAPQGNEFPGYDVEAVLGREVGPLPALVRVVTRKPSLWIGLEEVCLPALPGSASL